MQDKLLMLNIPLVPGSVNHIYLPTMYTGKDGSSHRGRKLTKEAKAFKYAVCILAQGRSVAPETEKERSTVRYRVMADVWLGKGQRGDADNFGKLILDGLQDARVIHSDAFVEQFAVTVHKDDRANPRTHISVERLEASDGENS